MAEVFYISAAINSLFSSNNKSQNVKIQAFWEIKRVGNWICKVRTCKFKHRIYLSLWGYTFTVFFLYAINTMAEEKKKRNGTVLNLAIKLQWACFFLESSIMINDRMNKKRLKLIGALLDKLLHFGNSLYRWCRSIRRLDMLSSKTTNKAQMSLVLFKIIDHD